MLPMRAGGLGLRSVTDHAYAAYIASFRGASELAQRIDSAFDPEDAENFSGILDATRGLEARVRPDAAINLGVAGSNKRGSACLLMPRQWPTSKSPRGRPCVPAASGAADYSRGGSMANSPAGGRGAQDGPLLVPGYAC